MNMNTILQSNQPKGEFLLWIILAFLGMLFLIWGCSETQHATPEYFRIDTDYRYHRYKDEAGTWIDVHDTCYYLHPYASGRYYHNSNEIHSWCSNPVTGETYHIMCDAKIGDTVSVDVGRDGFIEYGELLR